MFSSIANLLLHLYRYIFIFAFLLFHLIISLIHFRFNLSLIDISYSTYLNRLDTYNFIYKFLLSNTTVLANDRLTHMIAFITHTSTLASISIHKAFPYCVCNREYNIYIHTHTKTPLYSIFSPSNVELNFIFLVPIVYIICIPDYMHYVLLPRNCAEQS